MIFLLVIFISLLLLGIPIAFVMGLTSLSYFFIMDKEILMKIIASNLFDGMDKFVLMSIPFFLLAGETMNRSGITERLVIFCQYLVGRFRGGLGYVNILASFLFAGITGTALGDVYALGSIFIPAMKSQGYDVEYSAAITAASSIMGPIIPPSIIIILYGGITGTSIGALFAGALIPGVLIGISNCIYNYYISRKRKYPIFKVEFNFANLLNYSKDATLALIAPFIILGGILFGLFTPTEAGAIAVLYSFFIGFFVFKKLRAIDLLKICKKAVIQTSMLFIIIGMASILQWIIGIEQLPMLIGNCLKNISENPKIALLVINIFYLFLGTWMDVGTALILLSPIFVPIVFKMGVHPVHFGIITIVNLNIGLITPPLGLCLFAACGIANIKLGKLSKEILPLVVFEITALFLITFIPETVLFIPKILGLIK